MLMDLFVETLAISAKRRVHFHEFMLEVDALIRGERAKETGDPIGPVASKIAENVRCLAFDEMVVTNTADAAIMATTSGSLTRSCESTVQMTRTSFLKPSTNSGRIGRSIRREVSVSFSVGRASRLKKPPGILPAA